MSKTYTVLELSRYAWLSVCCFFAVTLLERADYCTAQSNWICVCAVAGVVFAVMELIKLRKRYVGI
jgi:hypothetical protein